MANSQPDEQSPKLRHPDEIDEIFGRANPNPNREGCPPKQVLIALARKQRPLDDPAYVHLTRCSPCYLEVRALQERFARERRRRMSALAAVAVLVLAMATGLWFVVARRAGPDVRAELDLRPYALTRSEATPANREPLVLPRGRATLTVLLPTGSEPGEYEIQILDRSLASEASGAGTASIANYVTTLRTTLNLSSMGPGDYQLAVRRAGQQWQLFPVRLQ